MKINLDLLPIERKQELKRKKFFRMILKEELLFIFPILIFIVILGNLYYVLYLQRNSSLANSSKVEAQDDFKELSQYEEKFKQVNESSATLLKIKTAHLHWSNIFEKIDGIVPEGVTISDFSTKNYKIFLVGKARNRDVLLEFKKNIESDQCFSEINVPLSNLVTRENVEFQIDFAINQDCLKKQ